jgi:uracil-DNA glycosylase family 4
MDLPYGRPRGPYYHGLLSEPDCWQCPLQTDTKVLPDGPIPARIAFVGEGPAQKEIIEGRGFVGPSGKLLWYIANACGIFREDVWVTNSALCLERAVKLSSGAIVPKQYVKAKAAMCCRKRLLRELIQVDPVVIVPLGNWALWALTDLPKAKIYSYRGSRIDNNLTELLHKIEQGLSKSPMREIQAEQ